MYQAERLDELVILKPVVTEGAGTSSPLVSGALGPSPPPHPKLKAASSVVPNRGIVRRNFVFEPNMVSLL
jgi:hypothetical protein